MFADTNDQLVLIVFSGCNLQYKPFCDWLTLIKRTRQPSKVSGFPMVSFATLYVDPVLFDQFHHRPISRTLLVLGNLSVLDDTIELCVPFLNTNTYTYYLT